MTDIAPGLAEEIMKTMQDSLTNNTELRRLTDKLGKGTATYADAHRVSQITGEAASNALQAVLKPEVLPDRRLYYNIGSRTITPAMEYANQITADYTARVQNTLNRNTGTKIRALRPSTDTESIQNLVGLADHYEDFAEGVWTLGSPVQQHVEHMVDRFARLNGRFEEGAGMKVMVTRTAEPDCCQWCAELEGTYNIEDLPKGDEVWLRHNNCRCTTEISTEADRRSGSWR